MKKIRALLGLVALVAAATLSVGMSSAAHADFNPCPDGHRSPPCTVYVQWPLRYDDGCPEWDCPKFAIGFIEDRILSVTERWRYVDHVNNGLRLLDQAATALDPAEVDQLRAAALEQFTAAATVLDGAFVQPGVVGVVDDKSGTVDPAQIPWLASAAEYLAGGLNLLVWGSPIPEPAISHEAMQRFDAAYLELSRGVQSG
jgi:hypothetical protein